MKTTPFAAPLALALVALLTGCGAEAVAPSQPALVFPTRADLAKIPARPPAPQAFGTKDAAVPTWTVESPPLPAFAPYDDDSPWGGLLRDLVKPYAAATALSPALRCASHEIARFDLENHALPVEGLRRFIVARCGGESPSVTPLLWSVDVPSAVSDATLIAKLRPQLVELANKTLAEGHVRHLAGLAAVRDAHRVVLVLTVAEEGVRLEPGSRAVDARRRVTLRGARPSDFASVRALINHGETAADVCEEDATVAPPRFALTCALAPGDSWDWVEVMGRKAGRMLETPLADVIVHEGDGSGVAYAAKSYGEPAPVRSPDDLTRALVEKLNAVRSKAKLAPLTLAPRQSLENARLAGTLVDAAFDHDDASADEAALGLLAGWDVEGTIRNGYFLLAAVAPTRDAGAWLASALERPVGRLTLLDPSVRTIAVGPAVPASEPALGAAVTTYALFDSADHSGDEADFLWHLSGLRTARGLSAPLRVATIEEAHAEARRVQDEDKAPKAALDDLLNAIAGRTGTSVSGYVIETNDPAHVDMPGALLQDGALQVMVTVAHHKVAGAAWGQYVVFVAIVGEGATRPVLARR